MELTDGVYALPLTFSRGDRETTIHPAAVRTDAGIVLLDAGFPGQADALDAALEDEGYGFDDVALVLLTHQDGDHAGGLREVRNRTGALTLAHRADAPAISGDEEPLKSRGERYPAAPIDVELVDGVTFRTAAGEMRVVATPGHTPGHVSLYFPKERLLVAADALTAEEGELAGPKPEFTPDADEAAESVSRLAELDVEATLCYHGGFVDAGSERIAEIRDSLG